MGKYRETSRSAYPEAQAGINKIMRSYENEVFKNSMKGLVGFFFWSYVGSLILLAIANLLFSLAFGWSFLAVYGWNIYGLAGLAVFLRVFINILRNLVFKKV